MSFPETLNLNFDSNFLNSVLLDQGPFSGTTDCPYFELHVTLPMGFKARVVLLPAHLLVNSETQGSCLVLHLSFAPVG